MDDFDCYGLLENEYDDYCDDSYEYHAGTQPNHAKIAGAKIITELGRHGMRVDSLESIEKSDDEDVWIDLTSDKDENPEDQSREFEEPEVYEITSYEEGQRLDTGREQHSKYLFRRYLIKVPVSQSGRTEIR